MPDIKISIHSNISLNDKAFISYKWVILEYIISYFHTAAGSNLFNYQNL